MVRSPTQKQAAARLPGVTEGPTVLIAANVVVMARNYNPSIVSRDWLYQKGILTDATPEFMHTPVFSMVESDQVAFGLDEDRMQITAKKLEPESPGSIAEQAIRFIDALPETPYSAVGFNYQFAASREACDLQTILVPNKKRLDGLLGKEFDVGGTLVFQFDEFSVTVSLSPSVSANDARTRIAFNFHSSVTSHGEAKHRLEKWPAVLEKAESIARGLCASA